MWDQFEQGTELYLGIYVWKTRPKAFSFKSITRYILWFWIDRKWTFTSGFFAKKIYFVRIFSFPVHLHIQLSFPDYFGYLISFDALWFTMWQYFLCPNTWDFVAFFHCKNKLYNNLNRRLTFDRSSTNTHTHTHCKQQTKDDQVFAQHY